MAFLRFAILLLAISHNKANHMGEYNGCLRSKLFEEWCFVVDILKS